MPTDATWHPTAPHFPKLETRQICITCLLLLSGSLIFIVLVFLTILFFFSYFHFLYFSIVHWKRSIRCSKWVTFGCFRGLPRQPSFDIFTYPKISILFKYSYFNSISDNFFPTKKKKRHHSLHIKSSPIYFSYFAWNFGDSYIPALTIYLCTEMFWQIINFISGRPWCDTHSLGGSMGNFKISDCFRKDKSTPGGLVLQIMGQMMK